eukprot:1153698-Pelagomonas_calceolata.AAC.8
MERIALCLSKAACLAEAKWCLKKRGNYFGQLVHPQDVLALVDDTQTHIRLEALSKLVHHNIKMNVLCDKYDMPFLGKEAKRWPETWATIRAGLFQS